MLSVLGRGDREVFIELLAKVRYVNKAWFVAYLFDRVVCVYKKIFGVQKSFLYNIFVQGYVHCRLENFTDMLEIRDSLNTPIIMSSYNDATSFIIIDALNKVIYAYELRVKSGRKTIKKRIEK